MEELKLRYKQLLQAYNRLEYMAVKFIEVAEKHIRHDTWPEGEENEFVLHRDAIIQRFEFCYDLTWKFLKLVLKKKYYIETASPRSVFQECYHQGILTRDEVDELFDMIGARNETTHAYDEKMANIIAKRILVYRQELANLAKKLEISLN